MAACARVRGSGSTVQERKEVRMKFACSIAFATVLPLLTGAASAQFVRGNEAVKISADGARKVETPPPTAAATKSAPCAADAGCHAGSWHMVETLSGLQECTEAYARPGTSRASTYCSV